MDHSTKLVPLSIAHLPYFVKWFNSKELRHYLFPTTPKSPISIKAWLYTCIDNHHYYLAMCNQIPIGHAGLKTTKLTGVMEFSVIIASKYHRHSGHGHECLGQLTTIATNLGATHLIVHILPTNLASLNFFSRQGFIPYSKGSTIPLNASVQDDAPSTTLSLIKKVGVAP